MDDICPTCKIAAFLNDIADDVCNFWDSGVHEQVKILPRDEIKHPGTVSYEGSIIRFNVDSKDINKENWPFPPEPDNWAALWEERKQLEEEGV